MKKIVNISICKRVLIILTMVLSANSYALTNLEAFEFNDEAGTSFSSFANTGVNNSSWDWGNVSGATTDGNGILSIGPNLSPSSGQFYRKINYSNSPYTEGIYRIEIDFASLAFAAGDGDANIGLSIGSQLSSANDLARITADANNGSPRIQFMVAGPTGNIFRIWELGVDSAVAAIDFNINNQTATIYHDGIAQEIIDLGSNLTIRALQFKAQNFDGGSIGWIGSLKFIQLNSDSTNSSGTITVDASERLQKIEGFGASGAWYETSLNNHNDRNAIINKAFVELGLDIFRIQNRYLHVGGNHANTSDAVKDILTEAESQIGRDIKVLMSAWSPPASLKSTGSRTDGGTLSSDENGYQYEEYAQWWLDSYNYYSQTKGIDIDYISIQNEPNFVATWNSCILKPSQTSEYAGYNIAFEKIWQKMAINYGIHNMPKMIAPEHHHLSGANYGNYIDALGPHYDRIYGYGHHLYQDLTNIEDDYLTASNYDYKPLFQTEYGKANTTDDDITRKLALATLIHQGLTIENLSAYMHWGLWWQDSQGEGLIDLPQGNNSTYTLLPEYYAFKHYSAFVHADWRRLQTTTAGNLLTSSYSSADRTQLVVVIVNNESTSTSINLNIEDAVVTGGGIYQSTDTLDCAYEGTYSSGDTISIPEKSITTVSLITTAPEVVVNPNILFISIDDLRPQLRCYNEPQMVTPNFDRLAKDSYLFSRAYCQQGVCGPSRASIMTGMRPDTTGVYQYNGDFRDTMPWAVTLPMKLSENGYFSTAIGKIYHGSVNDVLSWDDAHSQGGGQYGSTQSQQGYEEYRGDENDLRDGTVAGTAVARLANLKNQQPFFYGVGFVRPHLPFVAPQTYWDLYDVNDLEFPEMDNPPINALSYSYSDWGELRNSYGNTPIPSSGPVSATVEQNLIHGYYACVSYVDTQIGRLLDALEAQGLADNTIVVLWGDHGFHLGDHGQWCKHSNFELDARVPLIVKVPWMEGAEKINSLVELLDVFPTLMELCGIDTPEELQGESLVPLMSNPNLPGPEEAVSQYNRGSVMGYSIRSDRYRYTEWRTTAANGGAVVGREIYDHFIDPNENTNIATVVTGNSGNIENLVVNGEFDNGDSNWDTPTSGTTLTILNSDNQLGADPLARLSNLSGANVYQDKLIQTIGYEVGKSYTLEFTARSSSNNRRIRVIWLPPGQGQYNNNVIVQNPTLSTSSQTFTYEGIVPGSTVANAQLQFQIGTYNGSSADVYIDSVRIYETGGSSTTEQHPAIAGLSANLQAYIGGAYKLGAGGADSLTSVLQNAGLSGSDALYDADPDGDGLINLVEYALNLNPLQSDRQLLDSINDSSGLPIPTIVEGSNGRMLAIEYMRRKGADEITYQPEFGDNLINGSWSSSSGQESITNIDSDWERVRVEDVDDSSTNSSRFGRLRLIFNP